MRKQYLEDFGGITIRLGNLPLAGAIGIYGSRLPRWRAAGRTGSDITPLDSDLSNTQIGATADTSWL